MYISIQHGTLLWMEIQAWKPREHLKELRTYDRWKHYLRDSDTKDEPNSKQKVVHMGLFHMSRE